MTAEEFDKKFDDGEEDITGLLDLSIARKSLENKDVQKGVFLALLYFDQYLDLCLHLEDEKYSQDFLDSFHSERQEKGFPESARDRTELFLYYIRNCSFKGE